LQSVAAAAAAAAKSAAAAGVPGLAQSCVQISSTSPEIEHRTEFGRSQLAFPSARLDLLES
jgi:hypothetical protein